MTISRTGPDPIVSRQRAEGSIVRIGASRQAEAIARLVGRGDGQDNEHALRFLRFARDHDVPLDELWASLGPHNAIRHVALAVPGPGRSAMVFASHPRSRGDLPAMTPLLNRVCQRLSETGVHLAQALLETAERLEREAFFAGGFTELARLSYLERPLGARSPEPNLPAEVTIEPYDPAGRAELVSILDATYEGTLDCPGLVGLRETSDILDGHLATGVFDASLWSILRLDGRGIGALLLNPSASGDTVELVYLGLAVEARGRGLATQLLRSALQRLAGRRERTVTLAVDERNAPAIAIYRREGFRRVLRRVALIRSVRDAPQI